MVPPITAAKPRTAIIAIGVTAAYAMAARLGFEVAFVAEQVTTVWAPTGIALAALLLWGRRFWPAVWLGAFIANAGTSAPLWTAGVIATGNTLEAVVAVWLLRRNRAFDPNLDRLDDAAHLILVAAGLATTISATIGVTTLCAAAVQPWSRIPDLWTAWWLGDALGALVVAPAILTTASALRRGNWQRVVLLVLSSMAITQGVFSQTLSATFGAGLLHYLVFPLVVVAAVQYGQPSTALVVLGVSGVSIWSTVRGTGPFASPEVYQGLIQLQAFMAVLAGTGLMLSAAMAERLAGQRRRGAASGIGDVLAEAESLVHAAPAILRQVCDNLEWQVGAMWLVEADVQKLRCIAVWNKAGPRAAAFEQTTRQTLFDSGVDLPGRVWELRRATWIEDVVNDPNFPRAPLARKAGIHGAFGFPVRLGNDVVGVVEFFTWDVATVDDDLLATMSTVGNQLGQFVARKRAEQLLRDSEARLREADRHKDEFLAMLAHELRNPLAPIRTGLELVRVSGDTTEAVARLRQMMERQIGHMVRLIDDLLDVSRISSGKIQVHRQPTPLTDIVYGAVEANRDAMEAVGIRLIVKLPTEPLILLVDQTRFVQVVSNLLNNATKFTDAGGAVTLVGEVVTRAGVPEFKLTVADTGTGIPDEMLPRVFDLFTQGEHATHRGQSGLGIGLALARRIVEMHGGHIEARSGGAGEGSEFTIRMPILVPETEPSQEEQPKRGGHAATRRVLVVDDNADAAETLASLVRAMGGEVEVAHNGLAAIQRAAAFKPDVIILDIGMPVMNGYEACRRIRQKPFGQGVLLVALTGWGQDRDKQQAADAGFDAHVVKPVDPKELELLLARSGWDQ